MTDTKGLNSKHIPKHIAIIMDGNGRWAKEREKDRSYGHQAGAETVHNIAAEAARLGVEFLTLYTFSSENWNRPSEEVSALMSLLMASIDEDLFMKHDIQFLFIGEIERLPKDVQESLNSCKANTSQNKGMCLVLALSYSSQSEITEAAKKIATQVVKGEIAIDEITTQTLQDNLSTHFMPNPDLLIRTGGEYRLSNYLLWQCAYTEFYFCDTFWPDFKEQDLIQAIKDYQMRERRFGKTSEQIKR